MKKAIYLVLAFSLVFSFFPEFLSATTETSNEMLHFIMTVKWGNVRGEVEDKTETNFDGSIAVSSDSRVTLIRTLLFETHNNTADKVTSRHDPVSWNSLIYGHWDSVRVLVSSPADDIITITAGTATGTSTQSTISKTAREIYDSGEPIAQDVGNGKEIVVKAHPYKRRAFILSALWGKTERQAYISALSNERVDFSGTLSLDSGGTIKKAKAMRFEGNDKINSWSATNVDWNSYIWGDVDGLLLVIRLDKNIDKDDTITFNFSSEAVGWQKSFSIVDLYHDRITEESIPVDGTDSGYGLRLSVWRWPSGTLIRAQNRSKVYWLEDDIKRAIPSPAVFNARGFKWDDIKEVSEDEVDSYADGDSLGYPDGTLIKGSRPTVYVVSGGRKRPFVSAQAFEGLGYNWGNIQEVDDGHLNIYEDDANIDAQSSHPEGALIRVIGKPTVFKIEGGKRKPIPSLGVFNTHKFDWKKVLVVSALHRDKFSETNSLNYPDGSLLSAPNGKVYKIDNGKKRWIRTLKDFNGAGCKWGNVVKASNEEVADFEEGEDVVGDDLATTAIE